MGNITVTVSEDRLRKLEEMATRFQVTLEDLVRVSLEEMLTRSDEDFQDAVNHVLNKNADLYQRLA
ncbi:MAG: DNA-binding protein [Anaerolineae bacterium]